MNNFGRAVLAVGLSAVMTFTNPECFFQTGSAETTEVAESAGVSTVQAAEARTAVGEGRSTTEVTKKKEETTSSEKNTGSGKSDGQTGTSTGSADGTGQTGNTGSTGSAGQTGSTGGSGSTSSGADHTTGTGSASEDSSTTAPGTSTKHTGDTDQTGSTGSTGSAAQNGNRPGSTESADQAESTGHSTAQNTTQNTTQSTTQSRANRNISSQAEAELPMKNTVKNIKNELAEEAAPDGSDKTSTFIPKIYNDTRLAMKNNKEYIAGYVYFNQTDSAWNQNGYCIARAGCGPTSMAVVITSLTGKWVTPLDTAIWGYQHGFYSSEGSSHAMIPAMAAAYGLRCQGVGTDYNAIKKALQAGKPVVCLMGPGYFTRGGHFMVLVAIDKNDCVTIADVGSRTRSAYKYRLSDVIAQSKGASAGGPFWVMTYDKESRAALRKKQSIQSYTQEDMLADFADVSYLKVNGDLPATLKEEKKDVSVKKVVSILTMSTGSPVLSASNLVNGSAPGGTGSTGVSLLSPVSKNQQKVVIRTDKANQSRDMALALKQDIARRQWEKKIPLSRLDAYAHGTIER